MSFRDVAPASIQAIIQNGLLDRTFQEALAPQTLWDTLAELRPWGGGLGAQSILTRGGLMTPNPIPVTGSDATADSYGFEQYSIKMDQFGRSIDTNMVESAMALASKFLEDNHKLGIHAAQTLNLVGQGTLYGVYGEGTTWATAGITSSTALVVADATGFQFATGTDSTSGSDPDEGLTGEATPILVPVSSSNPISVQIGGVANTVTGVNTGTNTLTLGTAATVADGAAVVNVENGPVQYRPNGRLSANQLISTDVATLQLFQSAVTRLRTMNVPRINGAYTAHVGPETVEELFQDTNFLLAYRGRGDSAAYRDMTPGDSIGDGAEFMGRFSGIDWVMNNVVPTGTNQGEVTYTRPIVSGADSLIKGPFDRMADLVSEMQAGATVDIDFVNGVARILRAPLDRFGQVLSSTWSWIGGYSAGTDLLTGDGAAYKRAVVLEHA